MADVGIGRPLYTMRAAEVRLDFFVQYLMQAGWNLLR